MREICMLRARWRGLETEPRTSLHGHEGGNPGHSQEMPYGPPRQSSTLPGVRWKGDEDSFSALRCAFPGSFSLGARSAG